MVTTLWTFACLFGLISAQNFDNKTDLSKGTLNNTTANAFEFRLKATEYVLGKDLSGRDAEVDVFSANVNLDWTGISEASTTSGNPVASTLSLALADENDPSWRSMNGDRDSFLTVPDLLPDKIYTGRLGVMTKEGQVRDFIRGEREDSDSLSRVFEVATPFLVPDGEVKDMLETRDLLEKVLGERSSPVKMNYVNFRLAFPRVYELGRIIEISRYYRNEYGQSLLSSSEHTVQLLPPVQSIRLPDQAPDELVRISIKMAKQDEAGDIYYSTEHAVNVFTGGVYPSGLLGKYVRSLENNHTETAHGRVVYDSRYGKKSARCYTDDTDEFSYIGYPCRNSDVCIPKKWVCDGEVDCKSRDDEYDCIDLDEHEEDDLRGSNCRKYEFQCRAKGRSTCLPNSWLCDGRIDCQDGWDEKEQNCYKMYNVLRPGYTNRRGTFGLNCQRNHFRCWDGKECVSPRDVCDGEEDCFDGSDERICQNWSPGCDSKSEFRCYPGMDSSVLFNRNCIPRSWVCDDFTDCPNGEDESIRNCGYNRFSLSNLLWPLKPLGIF